MGWSFFGLRETDKEYIYEEIFQAVTYCRASYSDAWDMPVAIRKWWITRTAKENERKKNEFDKLNKKTTG